VHDLASLAGGETAQIAEYERHRNRVGSARACAPIVRLCAGWIAGPYNPIAAGADIRPRHETARFMAHEEYE
jgi:hypothetical protein